MSYGEKKTGVDALLAKGVAIVIPVRNRPDLLAKCLSSLASQDFSVQMCEVLVCDDGSAVDISEAVSAYRAQLPRIRLLWQPAKGPAAARNLGFRSSSAEILVCIDSDVVCAPDFVRELLTGLSSNPQWVAAEASVIPVGGDTSPNWDAPLSRGRVFISASSAYRAEALRRVGGFDESFRLAACEDTDLAARLLSVGEYGYVPAAIVYHPRRRVTLGTHWNWRRHWKYVMILAKRYGFLGFPGRPVGRLPRLRVSVSALVNIPSKRLLQAIRYVRKRPSEGLLASVYALFDFICGVIAFPAIILSPIPPILDYLSTGEAASSLPARGACLTGMGDRLTINQETNINKFRGNS